MNPACIQCNANLYPFKGTLNCLNYFFDALQKDPMQCFRVSTNPDFLHDYNCPNCGHIQIKNE